MFRKKLFFEISGLLAACALLFCFFPSSADSGEKSSGIEIISVYDNYRAKPGLETAWGFACVVKTAQNTILFDTGGDSGILLANMKKTGVSPSSVDKVVISHIHGDHAGGLRGFLQVNSRVTVFIPASFPESVKSMTAESGAVVKEVSGPRKICGRVYTTGELYGPPPEQSLIIDCRKGLIIITGCAHPGIVRIVEKAAEFMKTEDIYLVMGGFHHPPVSVVRKFREMGVEKAAPSHCTGDRVRKAFAEEYGKDFVKYGTGKVILP